MGDSPIVAALRIAEARHVGLELVDAARAGEVVRARLAAARASAPDDDLKYAIREPWHQFVFVTLCHRYGVIPHRRRGERKSSIRVLAPRSFARELLLPIFNAIGEELGRHFVQLGTEVMREAFGETAAPTDASGSSGCAIA